MRLTGVRVPGLVWLALMVASASLSAELPRFLGDAVWNRNVSTVAVHPDSATMISSLAGLGGFGMGRMQIDFSIHVVRAAPGSPTRTIVEHSEWGYYLPDCEPVGTVMPVPLEAAIEGETGLVCDNLNNDCHLLVVQGSTLYEAYSVTAASSTELESLCLAVWYLDAEYPPEGRGDHCTSADAAGFPMAPLLLNADEIAASLTIDATGGGDVGHAIRFILPNDRMATDGALGGSNGKLYVRPASHAGNPTGPTTTVPYGARLRLRSDFPLTGYSPAARVILHTFMRYGIVLADGGSVALTAESDLYTDTSWADLGITSRVFDQTSGAADVMITDFVVLDTGPRIGETYDCVRTVVTPSVLFADGFESGGTTAWSSSSP